MFLEFCVCFHFIPIPLSFLPEGDTTGVYNSEDCPIPARYLQDSLPTGKLLLFVSSSPQRPRGPIRLPHTREGALQVHRGREWIVIRSKFVAVLKTLRYT